MTAELAPDGLVGNLEDAWRIARLELLAAGFDHEPSNSKIAQHIARSATLRFIANLHRYPVSADQIIELRRGYRPETGRAGH
jgi:hypothetical protein